jgi:hypothetical protein
MTDQTRAEPAGPAFSLVALTVLLCYRYAIVGVLLFGERAAVLRQRWRGAVDPVHAADPGGWNTVMYDPQGDLRRRSPVQPVVHPDRHLHRDHRVEDHLHRRGVMIRPRPQP